MGKIKVGIIGIGNCFAGLYQGIEFYKQNPGKRVVGLMHEQLGPHRFDELDFVAAWDVGENKVGKPLHEAVYESPNMVDWVPKSQMPKSACVVRESPALDGVGIWVQNKVKPLTSKKTTDQLKKDALDEITRAGVEVLVNYLPVGSQKVTEFWAQVALESGCAFVNCIPVFIASDPKWEAKFQKAGVPIVGDDIKGLVGATIVHRTLANLCDVRGTKIINTYQINVGGNTDFLNMKEQERLQSKKISKTESVQSQLKQRLPDDQIYVGPSDFIPFLRNTKLMFMRIEGEMWAGRPYNMEVRLEVDDKANSAGIVIDAVRCAKIARDRKQGGAVVPASAYLMKHPPVQMTDPVARTELEQFVAGKK